MKPVKDLKTYYFQCDCSSQEHTIGVTFNIEDKEVCIDVQLSQYRGFFGRVWTAIKYVFGYQSKYGHWDVTLLNEDNFLSLYNTMTRYMHSAGIKDKSKTKIKKALQEHNQGTKNTMINSTHSENGNVLDKYKKDK